MSSWLLVAMVVGATVLGDLLQSIEMKRHGEIQNFHPRGLAKLLKLRELLVVGLRCLLAGGLAVAAARSREQRRVGLAIVGA